MKKVLLLTGMALILTASANQAFPVKKPGVRSKLRKEITAQLGFPNTLSFPREEHVPVRFKTDTNMNLNIIEVQTENEELRSFILQEFKKISIKKANLYPETEYRVSVNIKDLR